MNFLICLARLAQLQHETIDRLALQEAVQAAQANLSDKAEAQLNTVTEQLQLPAARWLNAPDAAKMPALLYADETDQGNEIKDHWGILRGRNAQGEWVSEWWDTKTQRWSERTDYALTNHLIATLKLRKPFVANKSALYQLIRDEIFSHKKLIR